jgi:hypothetical protein
MADESYAAALQRKLRLKPGQTALALNAPEEYVAALRAALGEGAVATTGGKAGQSYDLVSLFARSRADVEAAAPAAVTATRAAGSLWIMWRKKSARQVTDLDRDSLWPILEPHGWGPVASIAVDDAWSGLRFRPEGDIGRKAR